MYSQEDMCDPMLSAPVHLTLIKDLLGHEQDRKPKCHFKVSTMDTCKAHIHDYGFQELLSLEDSFSFSAQRLLADRLSVEKFMCILQTCREKRDGVFAIRMHVLMCENGLDTHRALGNHLIAMLVNSRKMLEAQQVFNKLVYRFDSSWNSLIQGYSQYGDFQHAFILSKRMQEDCLHPSRPSFLALLKACTRMMCVERGQELFTDIAKEGLEKDPFVSSTLVDMYAKCGLLVEAQEVFDEILVRDVVSWTTLISGYAEHGHLEEVLNCLDRMQSEGVSPDAVTFICSLKSCGSLGAIERGRVLHNEIVKVGYKLSPLVGNTLVDMYAKCGSLAEAKDVFEELPVRDVVSWSALMAGYVEHRLGDETLMCLEQMQLDGVLPNAVTYICSLKACASMGVVHKGQKVHADVVGQGYEIDPFIGNSLVDMYAKCGSLEEAREVFDELPVRDVIPWNALIAGYADHGFPEEALSCLKQMQIESVFPDVVTFVCSLKACSSLGVIQKGQELYTEILRNGCERDICIGNALVDMYAKCGSLAEAQEAFDELLIRDVVSWNILISGYEGHGLHSEALDCFDQMQVQGISVDAVSLACGLQACGGMGTIGKVQELHAKIVREGHERDLVVGNCLVDTYVKCGSLEEAHNVFDKLMPTRDIISWTAIIFGCAEQGESEKAFLFYAQMQEQGLLPNSVTVMSILKACGNAAALKTGKKVHAQICCAVIEAAELSIETALIDMYAKCGSMGSAQQVFDAMATRDHARWTTLITGYARQGESEHVLQLFERMKAESIYPDEITFLSILSACSRVGFVEDGQKYFEAMSKDYGIIPSIKHLSCMVDLLCRAGQLNEAVAMLDKLPFQADLVVWNTVLAACKKWGDVVLGRQAFERSIRLDNKHTAAFILMSSIYTDAQMWEEVKKIEIMKEKMQSWG